VDEDALVLDAVDRDPDVLAQLSQIVQRFKLVVVLARDFLWQRMRTSGVLLRLKLRDGRSRGGGVAGRVLHARGEADPERRQGLYDLPERDVFAEERVMLVELLAARGAVALLPKPALDAQRAVGVTTRQQHRGLEDILADLTRRDIL